MINLPEKSLLLVSGILLGAVLVLFLTVRNLGGNIPKAPQLTNPPATSLDISTNEQIKEIFSKVTFAKLKPATNAVNPFFTAYFKPPAPPPPPPAPTPPPPPPTTRKVELFYQGFLQGALGERRAFVLVGTNLLVGPIGTKVIADFKVTGISLEGMTLKNGKTTEVVVPFRAKKDVEVPVE